MPGFSASGAGGAAGAVSSVVSVSLTGVVAAALSAGAALPFAFAFSLPPPNRPQPAIVTAPSIIDITSTPR